MRPIPSFTLKNSFRWTIFFCWVAGTVGITRAERMMDSLDTFSVARSASYMRVKDGSFTDALSSEEKALEYAEDRYGKVHPSIVPVLNDLAVIHHYLGHYTQAEAYLKWGLAIREKAFGSDDPLVAESLSHMAALYNDWGRWGEAEFYGKRALSIQEKQPIKSAEGISQALNLLAEIELNFNKTIEAQNLLEQSRQLQEKNDSDPIKQIDLLNLLAKAYKTNKRPSDTESCLQKSLEIAEKKLAPDSVERADALEMLGDFYHSQGKQDKSQPLYESAFKVYKRFVGVNYTYPSVPYLIRMAKADQSLGDDKSAEGLFQKVLETTKEVYGPNHPLVAIALMDLAGVEKKTGGKQSRSRPLQGVPGHFKLHLFK